MTARPTATIILPDGYASPEDFALAYGFELAPLKPGCCSGQTPCAHQKISPTTLCRQCREAGIAYAVRELVEQPGR